MWTPSKVGQECRDERRRDQGCELGESLVVSSRQYSRNKGDTTFMDKIRRAERRALGSKDMSGEGKVMAEVMAEVGAEVRTEVIADVRA